MSALTPRPGIMKIAPYVPGKDSIDGKETIAKLSSNEGALGPSPKAMAAYAEYVSRNDYESGVELVDQAENVVMTRTFSKIYGLGGLRIGWMYGPAGVVDVISRLRQPFNVNLAAQAAGIAALEDIAHTDASRTNTDQSFPMGYIITGFWNSAATSRIM